ncbi:MAG TPA: PKD domain-containing protein [Solirubrobacterales bacterium]|nr:PKD domain-containing protein [Solirubrobacterales bacterium]
MLHGQLLGRLLIATAAVAVSALAAPAIEAARADAAQATIVSPGGSQQTLSLDAMAGGEDVAGREYVLRSGSGESRQAVTGFSLAALIEAAGADPFGFSYLEVLRPAGGAVLLSRDQALDPGSFPDGPPVVYASPAGTSFLRPSSGTDDLNASDSFEAPQGVTIALRKGSPLKITAAASTLKTRPGEKVRFSAEVEGAGAGETLTYSWYFDDGGSASGADATHSFSRPGSYDVVVGVTTPGDSTGSSAVVTLQVGPPLEGPDRKGGGTRRDREAPDHGAATGTGGSAGGPSGSGPAPSASPTPARPEPSRKAAATSQAPAGARISGELLSAPAAATPEPKEQPGARAGSPENESSGFGLPGAALGLLVTGGLLGLGAFSEARRLLP